MTPVFIYYLQTVEVSESKSWSVSLADFIRHNDETLLKSSEMMMNVLSVDFLPCTSFEELCDAAGININYLNMLSSILYYEVEG